MKQIVFWSRLRKFLNDIHLWAGLASGILVFFDLFQRYDLCV